MIDYSYTIAGDPVVVHFLEHEDDLDALRAFLRREGRRPLALDTETTGLDIYSSKFQIRLVQIGNGREAYVLRVDRFRKVIQAILNFKAYRWILHNAPYDALALFVQWFVADLREFITRCEDTDLMSRILDPRGQQEGGLGHGLKPLSAAHIDPNAPDTQAGLHKVFKTLRRPYAWNEEVPIPASWLKLEEAKRQAKIEERRKLGKRVLVSEGWRWIPIDHPTYVLYAGLDVILAHRLYDVLTGFVVAQQNWALYQWEKQIQRASVMLQSRGMLVDVPYVEALSNDWLGQYQALEVQARVGYGLNNINSGEEIARILLSAGVKLTQRTPKTGQYVIDQKVLQPLADSGVKLAQIVLEAKHIEKRRKAYLEATLELRDTHDRIHPWIKSMAARTARMSVSAPPYQQLPSHEWEVRRGVIADPGQLIVSADLSSVELRVLAALANVRAMKEAIAAGDDLHSFTAGLLFGEDFTDADRALAKVVGLGKVYGGGADTLARQTGLERESIADALQEYSRLFPEIRRYGQALANEAERNGGHVTTWRGRRLPVDLDFLYRAINYEVQSSSRDILAMGLLECERRGLDSYLLLPIHDELLGQAPAREATDVSHEIAEAMATTIQGVPITAKPAVYGRSWGSGYGCPAERDAA